MVWTYQNNLGFSLYTVPSIYCVITTSKEYIKSKLEMSTNMVYYHWTSEIKFNRELSLSIIRLINYSVATSLIYKLEI